MRFWLVSCVVAWSTLAFAGKPAVVLSGPPAVTKWVSKELSKKYTPSVATSAVSALPTAKEVRDVTEPKKAVALVLCVATGQFITLQVLNGADGTPLDTVNVKASVKKLPKAMPKSELAALVFAIGQGKAPGKSEAVKPPPEPEVAKEEPKKEDPKKEEPRKEEPKKEIAKKDEPKKEAPRKETPKEEPKPAAELVTSLGGGGTPSPLTALRLSFGVGGLNRTFAWLGNPSPALATANQPFSGNLAVDASWYPGAHFTSSFLANLGVFFTGDFGVGMVSSVKVEGGGTPSRFPHSGTRLRFGALVRLPVGDRFQAFAHLGYSRLEMTTALNAFNDGSARPNIPDVLFNGFRGGVGLRLRIAGTVELDALGGFHSVVGKGELGSPRYFPDATAFAVDAAAGLSVEIAPHLRLRGGAEWQRFFLTLNAADTSTFYAKSASDQYITAIARLEWAI